MLALTFLTLAAVFSLILLISRDYRLRVTTLDHQNWYRVQYEAPATLNLQTGESQRVPVTLTNAGLAPWEPGGESPTRLAYHWLSADGREVVEYEGLRTELPQSVASGASVSLLATVRAPAQPGEYILNWDMLQENRFWFSLEGSPGAQTVVQVSGPMVSSLPEPSPLPQPRFRMRRHELWKLAARMLMAHPWLGVGPDNFRYLYGRWAGRTETDHSYHTHNMYIEFFVNTGLIGGILFIWLLVKLVTPLKRSWLTASSHLGPLVGVMAAVLVILVHGLFDYFLEFTPTYLMIAATFGLAAGCGRG